MYLHSHIEIRTRFSNKDTR